MRLKTVLLALIIAVQGDAQKLLNPDICIGPLSSAPSCNFYEHKLQVCDNLQGSAAAKCYCPQTVLNAIAGCQSEFRICVQGYEYDSEFEGPQGLYALWHSACDGAISYTPTTPPITSLSATAGVDACLTAESNCAALGLSTESCTSSYSLSAELQHCFCQPAVLDLASRCEIDGSVSCLLKTPVSTNLWSYKQCRSAGVVSRTHSTAVVSSQVHLTAHTKSTATPPIASKASSATSASQTSAAGHTAHSLRSVLTFVAIWTLACVL